MFSQTQHFEPNVNAGIRLNGYPSLDHGLLARILLYRGQKMRCSVACLLGILITSAVGQIHAEDISEAVERYNEEIDVASNYLNELTSLVRVRLRKELGLPKVT